MRITALLLFVFGSAMCYNVEVYNSKSNKIPVTMTHNGVVGSMDFPAATPGSPSKWTLINIDVADTTTVASHNLITIIEPSKRIPAGTYPIPYIDITAAYVNVQGSNTDLAMQVYLPGRYPYAQFQCNYCADFVCFDAMHTHDTNSTMGVTTPYFENIHNDPYQIWFTDKASSAYEDTIDKTVHHSRMRLATLLFFVLASAQCYKINLYNNQSTPLSIQYVKNGVQSNVALPAKTSSTVPKWTATGLTVTDSSLFSTGNFAAVFVPTNPQTPSPTLDIAGSYIAWSPVNPNFSMKIFFSPSLFYIVCNEANVLETCKKSTSSVHESPATLTVSYVTTATYDIWFNPM